MRGTEEFSPAHNRHSYDGDLTPDEVFAMFFGHQVRGRNNSNFRSYTYRAGGWSDASPFRRQRQTHFPEQNNENGATGIFSLCQFLPLLLLFIFALLSSSADDPIFQLEKTSKYSVPMYTTSGINYWVKADFDITQYDKRYQLEDYIEQTWIKEMKTNCYYEQQRNRMASYYQQKEVQTPSCEKLRTVLKSK